MHAASFLGEDYLRIKMLSMFQDTVHLPVENQESKIKMSTN